MILLEKLLPIALLLVIFTACEKENSVLNTDVVVPELVEYTESNPLITRASGDGSGLLLDCITILYPFDLVTEDSSVTTIESSEDFAILTEEKLIFVDFSYPLTISIDDEQSDVTSGEELGSLFASCVPSGGWEDGDFPAYDISYVNSCYALNYPVQLANLQEVITTVESEEELIDALSLDIYYFNFPFGMTHEDGKLVTVNNMDEIFRFLIECNGFYGEEGLDWQQDFEYIGCYLFSFPFEVVLDGEIITVNDHMEFCDLILVGDIDDFNYPMNLVDLDGNTVTANNTQELKALLHKCEGWDDGINYNQISIDFLEIWAGSVGVASPHGVACYIINYPIYFLNLEDNSLIKIDNQVEYNDHVFANFHLLAPYVGVYPMSMIYVESGEIITLETTGDIETLKAGCE